MNRWKRFWKYYIKGRYHCDTCPFCWGGEYMPGCDDYEDCGCYIKGEIHDKCRLLPPFRFLLGWGRRKKSLYYQAHQYDDYEEFIDQYEAEVQGTEKALRNYLKTLHYGIVYVSNDGKVFLDESKEPLKEYYDIYRLTSELRGVFVPIEYVPLKSRWKNLLKDTWNKFLMIFKPYFCK